MDGLENFMNDLHLAYEWKDGAENIDFIERLYDLTVLERSNVLARQKISDYSKQIKELKEENTFLVAEMRKLEDLLRENNTNLMDYDSRVTENGIQETF